MRGIRNEETQVEREWYNKNEAEQEKEDENHYGMTKKKKSEDVEKL